MINRRDEEIYKRLKASGRLSPEQDKIIQSELGKGFTHGCDSDLDNPIDLSGEKSIYGTTDMEIFHSSSQDVSKSVVRLSTVDELLERDGQREKDGFPRKIKIGRLIKPGKGGKDRVVVVPTTVEEKLFHDRDFRIVEDGSGSSSGTGDDEEGEVIGERPLDQEQDGGAGPGQGSGGEHEIESGAYELGKTLVEKFKLPNLQDKGKKKCIDEYTYDLTDRHQGFGQLLDKKATLRKIIDTNISLGRIPDVNNIDPAEFMVSPSDRIFRILSKEKKFESQAMIFFLRDYSGSMYGKPTELVVTQHVLIYSWLLFQYAKQVESRFILHDTEAKEVSDFYTYYNSKVAGGTQVVSAYQLVNEIVERESLAKDYNIYVFHGTDGDDWDTDGEQALVELKKMLIYTNRIGVTIAENGYGASGNSEVEKYLKKSGLLKKHPNHLRLDVLSANSVEERMIKGIKNLVS